MCRSSDAQARHVGAHATHVALLGVHAVGVRCRLARDAAVCLLVCVTRATRRLVIPERPIVAVATVTLDGTEIADYRSTRAGALWRDSGWGGPDYEIEITYDHGFEMIPDDLVSACRTASARLLTNTEGFVRLEVSDAVAEAYAEPWGFIVSELLVLDRYRRRSYP